MNEMMKNGVSTAAESYLTLEGVAHLWGKVKEYVGENAGGGIPTISGVNFRTGNDVKEKVKPFSIDDGPISVAFVVFHNSAIYDQNEKDEALLGPCYVFEHFISDAVGYEYEFYMMDGSTVYAKCDTADGAKFYSLSTSKWATEKYVDDAIAGLGGSGTVDWSDIQNKPDLTGLYHWRTMRLCPRRELRSVMYTTLWTPA